jgi:anaerobic selenocysteine-containing dehydrogenase
LLANFTKCKADGTTASGNWLYSGSFTEAGNMMARRGKDDPTGIGLYPNWSWCWPVNRRIIYNRASCDTQGRPWDRDRAVIWWDAALGRWLGDVPDYGKTAHPSKNVGAFIMKPEGHARLFGMGRAEGPFPEHYEPFESPVENMLSSQQINPCVYLGYATKMDKRGDRKQFPIVGTTYRVTEHWQTGIETRWQSWLCELMPEMFVELSKELAKEKGINNGDACTIASARGSIKAVAIVTGRFKPFTINGKQVHQIGIPWCYGYAGLATGDSANVLTANVGDANTRIPEYKAFLCDIRKGV